MNFEIEFPPKTLRDKVIVSVSGTIMVFLLTIILRLTLFFGFHGIYFQPLQIYWCDSKWVCLHEIGHKADHLSGWVSQSQGFRDALNQFSQTDHPWAKILMQQHGRDIREIYAELLESSHGIDGMPEILRKFYDWNFIDLEMRKYGKIY